MTEEQQMLRDSAERYLRDNYDFAARQALADQGDGLDTRHWQAFADMGWAAMCFPEERNGFGFGLQAIAPLAELLGNFLVREPLLESALLAGHVLASAPNAVGDRMIPGIMDGSVLATVPYPSDLLPVAVQADNGIRIQGRLDYVPSGGSATHVVTPAQYNGGMGWILVGLEAEGVNRTPFMNHDGRIGAHIELDASLDSEALLLWGTIADAMHASVYQRAMLLAAAEGVGAMQGALDLTVEYTKQRQQFGQPLASFQALQHRMADMLIQTELARSLVGAACRAVDAGTDEAQSLVLAAKAKVDTAARKVTQEAIQMHGGIATTNEYRVGHYFKRMALLESWPKHRDAVIAEFIQHRGETQ